VRSSKTTHGNTSKTTQFLSLLSLLNKVSLCPFQRAEFLPSSITTLLYTLVTTKKKANLILNVDGCIAVCFVDMLRSCGAFSMEEAAELVQNGCLNGLFVLGRSIGKYCLRLFSIN
jgi:hypothetical protein